MQLTLSINSTEDAVKGIATLTKYLQDSVRRQAELNCNLVEQNTKLIYINNAMKETLPDEQPTP